MKKIVIIAIVAVGLAVGYAYAHNGGYMGGYGHGGYGHHGGGHMMGGPGAMMGPGMMYGYGGQGGYANCPGWDSFHDSGWNSRTHQQYLDDTAGLRKELNDKRFEYMEMQRNPNSTSEQLSALKKDIYNIRTELQQKAEQYN